MGRGAKQGESPGVIDDVATAVASLVESVVEYAPLVITNVGVILAVGVLALLFGDQLVAAMIHSTDRSEAVEQPSCDVCGTVMREADSAYVCGYCGHAVDVPLMEHPGDDDLPGTRGG
jgi:hypothetical protein